MVHGELKPLRCFHLWHHAWLSGLLTNATKPRALATLCGRLSMILARANAGAIVMRSYLPSSAFNGIILDLKYCIMIWLQYSSEMA